MTTREEYLDRRWVALILLCAAQFVVVLLWYPETKGITLEEMQKRLGIA